MVAGDDKKETVAQIEKNLSIIKTQLESIDGWLSQIERNFKTKKKNNDIYVSDYRESLQKLSKFEERLRNLEGETYKLELEFKKLL